MLLGQVRLQLGQARLLGQVRRPGHIRLHRQEQLLIISQRTEKQRHELHIPIPLDQLIILEANLGRRAALVVRRGFSQQVLGWYRSSDGAAPSD